MLARCAPSAGGCHSRVRSGGMSLAVITRRLRVSLTPSERRKCHLAADPGRRCHSRWIGWAAAASSCSSRASAGVLHPSVLRGRLFSVAATAARSSGPCRERSVPFGKHCRSRPLVFSLVPRCHGLCGSQKYTGRPVRIRSWACWAHLGALVPAQRSAQLLGQRCDRAGDRVTDRLGAVAGERGTVLHPRALVLHRREMKEHREPGGALDQRADRGALKPENQITLPVSGHRPVLGLGRALADQ
jgi:hypothetical protein